MRLASYELDGQRHCGLVEGPSVRPFPAGTDLVGVISGGLDALPPAGPPVPLESVRLLPPVRPPSVRDFVTFEEHVEGVRRAIEGGAGGVPDAWYDAPTFYFSSPYALIGAHDDVPVPPGCAVLDFELEVAVIIGRAGRDLSPAGAGSHIAGYTL